MLEPNQNKGQRSVEQTADDENDDHLDVHELVTMRLTSVVDKVMLGQKKNIGARFSDVLTELSSIFNEQWFFVTNNMQIKLISTPPKPLAIAEDLVDPFVKIPVGDDHPCTEIIFSSHGFYAHLEKDYMFHCANGYTKLMATELRLSESESSKNLRTFNYDGIYVAPAEPSPYLLGVWEEKKRANIVTSIQKGFMQILVDRQQVFP